MRVNHFHFRLFALKRSCAIDLFVCLAKERKAFWGNGIHATKE